ncbi:MAG: hypothetical protein PHF35_02890 [Candidatus Moranbacteria bacterium]|nr:hypothetical protein [Candidatus Moranbacteria bacterium]
MIIWSVLLIILCLGFWGDNFEPPPLAGNLGRNQVEFYWNDLAGSKAFYAVRVGKNTLLTVEHGIRNRTNQLGRLGIKVLKVDRDNDVALIAHDREDLSLLKLGRVKVGEEVYLIINGRKICCIVLEKVP